MKTVLLPLFFLIALSIFATQKVDSDLIVQTSENKVFADSTLEHNPPEGIEETDPHFIVKGHKFWVIINNKRSPETYDKSSEIYQYYSQIPETLLQFNDGVTHATIVYKDTKNTYAVIEIKSE
jgi:hypothetical protein